MTLNDVSGIKVLCSQPIAEHTHTCIYTHALEIFLLSLSEFSVAV